jgi:two-component system sensor histidine kinase YesM
MVENSIRHGILVQENGGFIAVCILERDEKLIIKIIDNGVGMSRNMVQRLTAGKGGSGKPGGSGIGLVNVLERLRFIYPGCSIRIISRISRGTCIEIKLPLEECRHA